MNRASTSGPRSVRAVRRSIRHSCSAADCRKSCTPTKAHAAAHATAMVADATATSSATNIGPAMNITSISTESTEYAVESAASSTKRCRRKVRMQTVIGGKVAPAAAAHVKTSDSDACSTTAAISATNDVGKSSEQMS